MYDEASFSLELLKGACKHTSFVQGVHDDDASPISSFGATPTNIPAMSSLHYAQDKSLTAALLAARTKFDPWPLSENIVSGEQPRQGRVTSVDRREGNLRERGQLPAATSHRDVSSAPNGLNRSRGRTLWHRGAKLTWSRSIRISDEAMSALRPTRS
jgi:hypothetical protein